MSEQRPAHRRRRPQAVLPIPEEETAVSRPDEKPHRIVAVSDNEPDWLVSATNVSGAAGRRTGTAQGEKRAVKKEQKTDKVARENRAILTMKKKPAEEAPVSRAQAPAMDD